MLCMHNCLIPRYNILILSRVASVTELHSFLFNPSSQIKYNLLRDRTPKFFSASCMEHSRPWSLFPRFTSGLARVVIVCSSEEERFYWWLIEQTRGWGLRFAASVVLTTSLYQGPMDAFTDISNECRINIPVFFKWCPSLSLFSKEMVVKVWFIFVALSMVKSWKCKRRSLSNWEQTGMFYCASAWVNWKW